MFYILDFLLNFIAASLLIHFLHGIKVRNYQRNAIVAATIAIVNTMLPFIMGNSGIPHAFITIVLVVLLLNSVIIILFDLLISGFRLKNYWWAFIFGIFVSLINGFFEQFYLR